MWANTVFEAPGECDEITFQITLQCKPDKQSLEMLCDHLAMSVKLFIKFDCNI